MKRAKGVILLFLFLAVLSVVSIKLFGQGITIGNGQITGVANVVYDVAAGTNSTITTNGTLRTIHVNSPTTTQTNFIGGKFYTNNTGRLQFLSCSIEMVGAAVVGTLVTELQVGNGTTMSTLLPVKETTVLVVGITFDKELPLSGLIQPGQVYCITNTTLTGIGNSSTIVAGTGQLTTF